MIHFNMPRETLKYLGCGAVALGLWLAAYVWGIHLGASQAQDAHELQMAECRIELEHVQAQLVDLQLKLTECAAVKAGQCALDCEAISQERVNRALKDFTEVVCHD
tara:strand:+ start:1531 stop:1848 length:318 start_codon:yes stop_codon:yes gene_type:complete